jgi:hypothetical protein
MQKSILVMQIWFFSHAWFQSFILLFEVIQKFLFSDAKIFFSHAKL